MNSSEKFQEFLKTSQKLSRIKELCTRYCYYRYYCLYLEAHFAHFVHHRFAREPHYSQMLTCSNFAHRLDRHRRHCYHWNV
jgi:hypothetical protein